MNIRTHYLTRNKFSGIYYVRLDIPSDLHQHFGIKTLKRSLKTHKRFEASILCLQIISQYKLAFATLRGMPKLDSGKFMKLVTVKANGNEATFDTGDPMLDYEFSEKWMEKHGTAQLSTNTLLTTTDTINSTPISEVVEKYCSEQTLGGNWTDKTEGEFRSVYRLFLDIVGPDITCDMINSALARSYKETLKLIPPNMKKKNEHQGLSISQIIAQKPTPISVKTINKHLTRMSSLMKWAKNEGYLAENYFLEKTIKTKQAVAQERHPFTTDDINLIFDDGAAHKQKYRHWVPLLAYYTGARLNELCQLYINDIRCEDGIWYIDINDNTDDKRLKNESSKRRVPIHKSLKRLGFLDFVGEQKDKGLDRIFPELKITRDGYGGNASKWFSRYLNKQGVIHRKKSFHSFRHTFVEELKKAKIDVKYIAGLVGHFDDDITTNRYGTGEIPLEILNEAIQKLPPHIDNI